MIRINIFIVFTISSLSILFGQTSSAKSEVPYGDQEFLYKRLGYYVVSMIDLIAHPEYYDGKMVKVSGYFHADQELCSIFLTKDISDHYLVGYSIRVAFKENIEIGANNRTMEVMTFIKKYNGKYLMLMGIFDKNRYGYAGSLIEVGLSCEQEQVFDGTKKLKR